MQPQQPDSPAASTPAESTAFSLLHEGIQRQLWRMQWARLRPLQVDAIKLIMQTEDHLVLSAATASGKTEAAFLPILSRIAAQPLGSVRVMYVGPLKALINDQFSRVEELCGYIDVPVHRWHGDVSASRKTKLIESPGGVLLITPESLESLFVNRSQFLHDLFAGLSFVVIDELHSFLDCERGLHLQSLLARLRPSVSVGTFRLVGLSATIGDPSVAQRYLAPDAPDGVRLVEDKSSDKGLKLRIYGYREQVIEEADDGDMNAAGVGPQDEADAAPSDALALMAGHVVTHCRGHANLIFANSKADVEELADLCKREGIQQHLPDIFLVHHGSLSAEIREDAEATMKSGAIATAFCSSTLEMGIDIGSVHMVGQVGPPWSVASLKQRVGRSGRRDGEARVLRMYIPCREPGPNADIFDRVHLDLVQAIAVTQLMLSGWVEPAELPACDLSTLTQQIISVIAQSGGMRADRIYERLCAKGAFGDVEPKLFARLLRALAAADVVEQMPGDDLILGIRGERLRKDRGFYAVFPTPQEYSVLHQGQLLGTLACSHEKNDYLLFAGRRWQVEDVDEDRLEMHVRPARGWKRPRFTGALGELHARVAEEMRVVLADRRPMVFLDAPAQNLLAEARSAAASIGFCNTPLISLGPRTTALMTWTGTRIQQTLQALLASIGLDALDQTVGLVVGLSEPEMRKAAHRLLSSHWNPEAVARLIAHRERRKYDSVLGDELLDVQIARGSLDMEGAQAVLAEACRKVS